MASESGNILIYILVAIILFAALVFTFSAGMRGGTGGLDKGAAKARATAVLDYAQEIQRGVDKLLRKGCSENELTFSTDGSDHANSRAGQECHVFHPNGANVKYRDMVEEGIQTNNVCALCNIHFFNGDMMWHPDTPTAATELTFFLAGLDSQLCIEINSILDVSNASDTVPDATAETLEGTAFSGVFETAPAVTNEIRSTGGELANQMTGCTHFATATNNTYTVYKVLIPR